MGEKLKWLMQALDISGIELAEGLGVDYSTVSKWRTGKRGLKYRSEYISKLADYALATTAEKQGGIIKKMLAERHPELDLTDQTALRNALCLWLTVPEGPDAPVVQQEKDTSGIFPVQVETSLGVRNMFEGQRRFFRLLRDMEPGQAVTVADFGAVDWTSVDITLVENIVEETLECLNCGHFMQIIDHITETYRPWDYMFRFFPIYLHKNVTSFFFRDPQPAPLRQNMFLIEGKASVTVSSTASDPDSVITAFYNDPEYVRFFDTVKATMMANSHLMIRTMEVQHIHELLDIIDSHMKSSRLLYMMNRLPTFRNMTQELLREILTDNGVEDDILESCLLANKKSASTRGRCRCRQIYDLDAIEALSQQVDFVEQDLSCITGRQIKITRKQFLGQLEHIKENIRDEFYTLVLFPFSELRMSAPPINVIVQDDSLSAAWDVEKYARRMYSEDLSIVNGFYQYTDSIWEQIPPVCKTEEWCKRQIDRILTNLL